MKNSNYHNVQQLNGYKTKFYILLPICLLIGVIYTYEWFSIQPAMNDQIMTGKILGIIERTVLIIQLDESNICVNALLSMNGSNFYRDKVTFYFSGDPEKEVYLLEEHNPLYIGLFFLLTPLIGLAVTNHLKKKENRG